MPTLKVGSSLVNLLRAFEKAPEDSLFLGATARLITGSGTVMLVMAYLHPHMPQSVAAVAGKMPLDGSLVGGYTQATSSICHMADQRAT